MNLDLFPLGWVHLVASLVALAVGIVMLLRAKGTHLHKRRGAIYVVAILITAVTSLGIYRNGHFIFAHWLAIAAVGATVIGFLAARLKTPQNGWVHVHLTCMLLSCYLLFGGSVNELFLRVNALRSLAPDFFHSPIIGMTHVALSAFFIGLAIYFNFRVAARQRTSHPFHQEGDEAMR